MAIAVVLLICVGVRRELAAALSVGDCVALAALPITWTAVRKARRLSLLLILSILAAGTAYIMSLLAENSFVVEAWARRATTLSLLAVPCAVAVFVWGARRLGTRRAAMAVGFGMFLDALPLLQTSPNPWKFGVGAAVTIMVLSFVANRRRLVQIVALLGLSGVFLVSDSRSTLAFLAIILGTVIWQALASWARWNVPTPRSRRRRCSGWAQEWRSWGQEPSSDRTGREPTGRFATSGGERTVGAYPARDSTVRP